MTIANVLKPWVFTNGTEVANATKVNSDFDVVYAGANECINELTDAAGSRGSLTDRLAVSFNDDGTIKTSALPVGSYDTRTVRVITENDTVTEDDSIIFVDATAGDIILALPSVATSAVCPTIKLVSTNGNTVTITPDGADTVMGLTEAVLAVGGETLKLIPYDGIWWSN